MNEEISGVDDSWMPASYESDQRESLTMKRHDHNNNRLDGEWGIDSSWLEPLTERF